MSVNNIQTPVRVRQLDDGLRENFVQCHCFVNMARIWEAYLSLLSGVCANASSLRLLAIIKTLISEDQNYPLWPKSTLRPS